MRFSKNRERLMLKVPRITKNSAVAIIVFFIVLAVHFSSRTTISFDSMWSIHTSLSLLREGNTDLNEYSKLISQRNNYGVETFYGKIYTVFPIGSSILAVPFVFFVDQYWSLVLHKDFQEYISQSPVYVEPIYYMNSGRLEKFVASFYAALASVMIFFIARLRINISASLLITAIFAFGTTIYSNASRGLMQHAPSVFMLSIALYMILKADENPRIIQFIGLPLFASYIIRPTNSLSIVFFTVIIFIKYRVYFFRYVILSLIIIIPFIIYNILIYHRLLQPYYRPERLFGNPEFFSALLANIFSPGRGLFIFSPVLLYSIVGFILAYRNKRFSILEIFIACIIILHWIVISSFGRWWAGHSYGPRFFTDMTVYFAYFLIIYFSEIGSLSKIGRIIQISIFSILCVLSVLIHLNGANNPDVYRWNNNPNIDENRSQIWNWNNLQFLYQPEKMKRERFEHIMEKAYSAVKMNDIVSAEMYSKKAAALYPESFEANFIKAAAEKSLHPDGFKISTYINLLGLIKKDSNPKMLEAIRDELNANGITVDSALKETSANGWVCHLIAGHLEKLQHPEDAIAVWQLASNRGPDNAEFHLGMHRQLMKLARYDEALREAENALNLSHSHPYALLYIGDAHMAIGDSNKSAEFWNRCLLSNGDINAQKMAKERLQKLK